MAKAPHKQNQPPKSLTLSTLQELRMYFTHGYAQKTRWQPSMQPVSSAHSLTQSWQKIAEFATLYDVFSQA